MNDIPEFRDLNLSQIEFEKNVSVDDETRGEYSFSSIYDVNTKDSWKSDFIDLDAFIQNVLYHLNNNEDDDCFLCTMENSELCNTCSRKPREDFYSCLRTPRGKFTLSCNYNCYKGRYICCKECDDVETCDQSCDGSPDTCGLELSKNEWRPIDDDSRDSIPKKQNIENASSDVCEAISPKSSL